MKTAESVGSDRPVPFDRLLSVAALTPAQASLVAVQLLDAADLVGPGDDGSLVGVRLGAVTLMPSGEIDVRPSRPGEGKLVSDLLRQLLQNARRLPSHPRPQQLSLLSGLEAAAGEPLLDPGARARALEKVLADALGPGARQRLAGQLAALVDAFGHVAPGAPRARDILAAPPPVGTSTASAPVPTSVAPASSQPESHRAARPARAAPMPPPARSPRRRARSLMHRHTRGRVALVTLVLASALAVSGLVVLHNQGVDFAVALGLGSQPAAPETTKRAQPATSAAKKQQRDRPPTVSTIAPRQAGPITGVSVQMAGSCTSGALCPVKVTVHLRPASTTQAVTWKVGAARVCKSGTTWSAPTTVTAQPGWATVYASTSVRLPQGRSLALVALTSAPARAQSRPVPVAGSALRC